MEDRELGSTSHAMKIKLDAKSYTLSKMYDILISRSLSIDPFLDRNILICNTMANQYTIT